MSEHYAQLHWDRKALPFTHESYNTSLEAIASGQSIAMATANTAEHIDPEQALAMSLSSCHMLTFLALAAKKRLVVESYDDNPVAYVEQNEQGLFHVPKIILHPRVVFADKVKPEVLTSMHEKAHKHCFISNSLNSEVLIEPEIEE